MLTYTLEHPKPRATHAVRATLVFGILAGLGLATAFLAAGSLGLAARTTGLALWACLVLYSLMLCRWSETPFRQALFPLLLPLAIGLAAQNVAPFLVAWAGVLTWVRSGLCGAAPLFRRVLAEMILCLGAGGLSLALVWPAPSRIVYLAVNTPTALQLGLALWFFFLLQSLYFVFLNAEEPRRAPEQSAPAPFERAKRRAEAILAAAPE